MKTTSNRHHDLEKAQVQLVLDRMIAAQENGDWEQFSQCFEHNSSTINIGTDLDEFWIGWETFKRDMQRLFKAKKGHQINVTNTHINFNPDGDVAWYAQMIDTSFETKGEPVRIEGFRHTGVMILQNGEWRVVQSHISVPVLDDVAYDANNDLDMLMQI